MQYRQYRFKFYLNASHAIYINGALGERHPHTWEISINVLKMQEDFVAFNKLEVEIEAFIEHYQNSYLNDKEPFTTLNPTLENCCWYFKEQLTQILNNKGWLLLMIEMSETPTRSYVINLLDEENTKTKQAMDSIAASILQQIIETQE